MTRRARERQLSVARRRWRVDGATPNSAVAARAAQFILSTKVGRYGQADFDFSAERVRRSVEESLSRLQVQHIDIVQCHDIEFGDLDQVVRETLPGASARGAPSCRIDARTHA